MVERRGRRDIPANLAVRLMTGLHRLQPHSCGHYWYPTSIYRQLWLLLSTLEQAETCWESNPYWDQPKL